MIKDTLAKIKKQISSSKGMTDAKKEKLLILLDGLSDEIGELSKTNESGAQSITNFAEATTHEATRANQNKQLVDVSLEGLKTSVSEFETSHPELTKTVSAISEILSNIGI